MNLTDVSWSLAAWPTDGLRWDSNVITLLRTPQSCFSFCRLRKYREELGRIKNLMIFAAQQKIFTNVFHVFFQTFFFNSQFYGLLWNRGHKCLEHNMYSMTIRSMHMS